MAVIKDLTGRTFGKLHVTGFSHKNKHGQFMWNCTCQCGNTSTVCGGNLKSGSVSSCGCGEAENRKKFGTRSKRTHLSTKTRLYRIWLGMKTRCYNQNDEHWDDYGGRGITVCDEWKKDFQAFKDWSESNYYASELSIERKNVNGNYCPENCCWIPLKEQQTNKRNTRFISFNGKTQNIHRWAAELGVTDSTIRSRIRRGENPIEVLKRFTRCSV